MKQKLIKALKRLQALFPTALPVGVPEFEKWADTFSEIYDLPTLNQESIRFVLASAILNLGTQVARKSKHYFYLTMMAGASKQIAGSVFYNIKQAQREAEAAAKLAEQNAIQV